MLCFKRRTETYTSARNDEVPAHAAVLREAESHVAASPDISEQLDLEARSVKPKNISVDF